MAWLSRRGAWACLGLILLFTLAVRLRLLACPLERDEGEYAYAGQLILQGIPPYRLVYNMKFPGVYAAYALIMALFGQTPAGIHFGVLLVNLASIVLVFLLARRLFDDLAAVGAAAAYALLSASQWTLGFAGHATHFVVLPVLGAVLLFDQVCARGGTGATSDSESPRRGSRRDVTLAGILMGLALLMKQPAIFFVVFGAAWILARDLRGRGPLSIRSRASFDGLVFYCGGVALPLLVTLASLAFSGVFHRFWFWTIAYARAYGSEVPLSQAGAALREGLLCTAAPAPAFWILAGVGLVLICLPAGWFPRTRTPRAFVLGFAAASFLAVCPGFYFRQHYFILMLPALALLGGAALHHVRILLTKRVGRTASASIPAVLLLLTAGLDIRPRADTLFRMGAAEYCRHTYGENPFVESAPIAGYLRSRTGKDARIAVLGSEPQIYFYAHRHSATGYIYTYALMEPQPYASRMQREMISDIESAMPEYVIFVNIHYSWLRRSGSDATVFDWAQRFISRNYELAGVVGVPEKGEASYHWGADLEGYSPPKNVVSIFHRKAGAGAPCAGPPG